MEKNAQTDVSSPAKGRKVGSLPGHYETIREVLDELSNKSHVITRAHLTQLMDETGLHCPLSDIDIDELAFHSRGSQLEPDAALPTLEMYGHFREEVVKARFRLSLPAEGLSEHQVRKRHDALLDEVIGRSRVQIQIGQLQRSAKKFWGNVILEARGLCGWLKMDPAPLDRIREVFAKGGADCLFGFRKLLNPEGVFRFAGREVAYHPSQTDRLIGHLLWGLPLNLQDISPRPSIAWKWELLPDGGGKFQEESFALDKATARELRELQAKLRWIKRTFRRQMLMGFRPKGTWEEKWKTWNRLFPDLAFPSSGAMRKAESYQRRKRKFSL